MSTIGWHMDNGDSRHMTYRMPLFKKITNKGSIQEDLPTREAQVWRFAMVPHILQEVLAQFLFQHLNNKDLVQYLQNNI